MIFRDYALILERIEWNPLFGMGFRYAQGVVVAVEFPIFCHEIVAFGASDFFDGVAQAYIRIFSAWFTIGFTVGSYKIFGDLSGKPYPCVLLQTISIEISRVIKHVGACGCGWTDRNVAPHLRSDVIKGKDHGHPGKKQDHHDKPRFQ
jgi:hypothetical protein